VSALEFTLTTLRNRLADASAATPAVEDREWAGLRRASAALPAALGYWPWCTSVSALQSWRKRMQFDGVVQRAITLGPYLYGRMASLALRERCPCLPRGIGSVPSNRAADCSFCTMVLPYTFARTTRFVWSASGLRLSSASPLTLRTEGRCSVILVEHVVKPGTARPSVVLPLY
jgi:hypothetical protein